MDLGQIISNPPAPHRNGTGPYFSLPLTEEVLRFIGDQVNDASHTLETGCGLSTVLFALSRTRHICITPLGYEIERLKEYCEENKISTDRVTFHAAGSEKVLPGLQGEPLDLVLIDGRHGFPAPFIDFYYTAEKLKIGGLIVVDDTWLWTGDVLKQYLMSEPEWKHEAEFPPRTSVFRKLAEGSQSKEWCFQDFVVRQSRLKLNDEPVSQVVIAFRHLRRWEFSVLGSKIFRKLRKLSLTN